MSAFTGSLMREDRVVLPSVVGTLQRDEAGWRGQLVLPRGCESLETGEYQLVLENGQKGRVLIGLATWEALPTSLIVPFEGSGPLT